MIYLIGLVKSNKSIYITHKLQNKYNTRYKNNGLTYADVIDTIGKQKEKLKSIKS